MSTTIVNDAIRTINPTTGEKIHDHAPHSHEQVEGILTAARDAFPAWRALGFDGRAEIIRRVAVHLRKHKSSFAEIATHEMGKPIVEAEAEVEKCAWTCEYFAERAVTFLAVQIVETNAAKTYVAFRPIGAVLAIMPWN